MKTVVLITNANVNTYAGNITLILRRAEAIYNVFDYSTRIIVYKGISQEKAQVNSDFYSIDYTNDTKELFGYLKTYSPRLVILYGYSAGLLAPKIKKYISDNNTNCEVIYDVQGAVEEKWEYAASIKGRIKFIPQYFAFKKTANIVDSFFVVSDELRDNCLHKIRDKNGKKFYKIRCGINEVPGIDELKRNRMTFRNKYGIPKESVVFAYSGYRSPWQKVDEIVDEFSRFDKEIHNTYFCFFCNSDDKFLKKLDLLFPRKNFMVALLGNQEYIESLSACDVGYILRDYKETNRVAFPNKFSDYLSSGMLIGLNRSLPEPMRVLLNNGLPYVDTDEPLEIKVKTINEYMQHRLEYISTSRMVCQNELLYSEQVSKSLSSVLSN